jgi:hypothetical protein
MKKYLAILMIPLVNTASGRLGVLEVFQNTYVPATT